MEKRYNINVLAPAVRLSYVCIPAYALARISAALGYSIGWYAEAILLSPVVVGVLQIVYYSFKDPDRLQLPFYPPRQVVQMHPD